MNTKQTKRVLVVDDDPHVLDAIHGALANKGYEVIVAHDGTEGLVRAERDAPDLIVLDVLMPKRSGFAVLERLGHRRSEGPRIIVVTANDDLRYREFVASKGVDGFLRKPFPMDELLTLVNTLLETGAGVQDPVA